MGAISITLLATIAFAVSAVATGGVRSLLSNRAILDHPGARSSHRVPTPRGGGLAIFAVLITGWGAILVIEPSPPSELGWIMLCSFGLAVLSWADDLVGLPMIPRLLSQIAMASFGTFILGGPLPVFQGYLPTTADAIATAFLWVGFINLFNFADGIDGNAGAKATALGIGIFALALVGPIPPVFGQLAVTMAAVAAGFLLWNWHPARIFMGDVGSVPLGFLLAWLLLRMATEGQWAPALILPLVYLSDTGITYLIKIARGERFWRPHRDHFYQRAAQRDGVTHAQVVKVVLLGDVVLIGFAILATQHVVWPSLLGAGATAGGVVMYLCLGFRNGASP